MTTDVASRGIDIEDLSHVFIFSTPDSPEQYIHRAGRTGRVGKTGRAISLVGALDLMNFNRLVKRYHVEVKELPVPTRRAGRASARPSGSWTTLAEAGRALSIDDFVDLGPVARQIAAHELRDRIVALLLKSHFAATTVREVDEEDPAPQPQTEARRRADVPATPHAGVAAPF